MTTSQPFRLLDFTAELRLMVYENIERTTNRHVLMRTDGAFPMSHWPNPHSPQSATFFSRKCLPVALLATWKQVHHEAENIMQAKMADLNQQPIRYLVDWPAANAFVDASGPLSSCLGQAPNHRSVANINPIIERFVVSMQRPAFSLLLLSAVRKNPNHNLLATE